METYRNDLGYSEHPLFPKLLKLQRFHSAMCLSTSGKNLKPTWEFRQDLTVCKSPHYDFESLTLQPAFKCQVLSIFAY